MANDPNRDLLPVKEDCCRSRQGPTERNNHLSLTKLSRCELEDKVYRLLDEQTHLKKLANSQEEKIKRLGTKLLRLINEKKHTGKNADHLKTTEDLEFQFLELEHENYALKDKITVLRQQLASQSRHIAIRSPVRSNHISPLMSMRHSGSNDITFESGNKTAPADVQLHEAEVHIKELNNEIKSLHNKVGYLQQDLEKNNLDNRKTKVTENIEFIRLQRTLKQQAIQIAALQAQIKNSEKNQRVLKNELLKAHNENDEALHLISVKQNEILNLCSKLEEGNLNRLEEGDLKQRINDLTLERDILRARADLLMKTIEEQQHAKPEKVKELETVTHEEKLKTKKPEENPKLGHNPESYSSSDISYETRNSYPSCSLGVKKSGMDPHSKDGEGSADVLSKSLNKNDASTSPIHSELLPENKSIQTGTIYPELINENESKIPRDKTEREDMEKIKMELELQHLREMLRNQTCRCEAQQNEISRLLSELKLSENKCQNTLQKLDRRLSAFENLEARTREKEFGGSSSGKSSPLRQTFASLKTSPISRSKQIMVESENDYVKERVPFSSVDLGKQNKNPLLSNTENYLEKPSDAKTTSNMATALNTESPMEKMEPKRRFVDQVFLESSEENLDKDVVVEDVSNQKERIESNDKEMVQPTKPKSETREKKSAKSNRTHKLSPVASEGRDASVTSEKKDQIADGLKFSAKETPQKFVISISWLEVDSKSSLWSNAQVKLLFVDFTFLDLHGENTETPESLPKPTIVGHKCEFNFVKEIEINENRRKVLQGLMNKPDLSLIIFKVVSDSEDFDQLTEFDCEDVGVAVVTVKMFLEHVNGGFFTISVRNTEDTKEVIGTLCIAIGVTPGLFTPRNNY